VEEQRDGGAEAWHECEGAARWRGCRRTHATVRARSHGVGVRKERDGRDQMRKGWEMWAEVDRRDELMLVSKTGSRPHVLVRV
jgi:hypothetical protein